MDSRKKNSNNYGRVMSRVFNRSRSSLRSASNVTRHDAPSSVRVGAKPSVSVSAVSSSVFTELPTVLNDFEPDDEREKVIKKRSVRRRRTLKSLDPSKAISPPRTSRDRGIEYSRNVRARGSAPAVLDRNGEEWSEAHVRQCHSSRSHTRLQELKDEIKAFSETDKLLKLRSHLYKSCGVVLDDVGRVARDQAVQADPVPDKGDTPLRLPMMYQQMEIIDRLPRLLRPKHCSSPRTDPEGNRSSWALEEVTRHAPLVFHCQTKRREWLTAIDREDLLDETKLQKAKNNFVCSAHFDDSAVITSISKRLESDAVPTKLLPHKAHKKDARKLIIMKSTSTQALPQTSKDISSHLSKKDNILVSTYSHTQTQTDNQAQKHIYEKDIELEVAKPNTDKPSNEIKKPEVTSTSTQTDLNETSKIMTQTTSALPDKSPRKRNLKNVSEVKSKSRRLEQGVLKIEKE